MGREPYRIIFCVLLILLQRSLTFARTNQDPASQEEHVFSESHFISGNLSLLPEDAYKKLKVPDSAREYSAEQIISPGFYRGYLWVLLAFPGGTDFPPQKLNIVISTAVLDQAEAYTMQGGAWLPYRRTGRNVRTSQMDIPNWIFSIPFETGAEEKEILLRIKSREGSRIRLLTMTTRDFYLESINRTISNIFISGIFLLITMSIFIEGALRKDGILILLALEGFSLELLKLHISGLGPVFFWNYLAGIRHSYKFIYLAINQTQLFMQLAFIQLAREEDTALPRKILFLLPLTSVSFLLPVIIRSEIMLHFTFPFFSCIQSVLLITYEIMLMRKARKSIRRYLYFWIPVNLIFLFVYMIPFRNSFSVPYQILNLEFLLVMIPPVCFNLKYHLAESMRITTLLNDQTEEIRKLRGQKRFFDALVTEIMDLSNIMINSTKFMEADKSGLESKSINSLLQKTSMQLQNKLDAVSIIQSDTKPKEVSLIISRFFEECVSLHAEQARRKGITIQNKCDIPQDTVLRSDPNLLSMIFSNSIESLLNAAKRGSTFCISLQGDGENITVTLRSKMESETLKENLRKIHTKDASVNFLIMMQAVEVCGGSLEVKGLSDGMLYRISLPIHSSDVFSAQDVPNHKPARKTTDMEFLESQALKSLPPILMNNQPACILFAENNESTRSLFQTMFANICVTVIKDTGADAWDYLSDTSERLPDIIFCSYSLMHFSSRELLRKCQESPRTQDIPFIFILNTNQGEKKLELIRLGAVECLVKPFGIDNLLGTIYSTLRISMKSQHSAITRMSRALESADHGTEADSVRKDDGSILSQAGLSTREMQISLLIIAGLSDKEIAEQLNISPATVATHNKKLFKKLGVHSRVELINKVR